MSSISSSTGCFMFRVSHHLQVPSVEEEKKSVPVSIGSRAPSDTGQCETRPTSSLQVAGATLAHQMHT